MIQFHTFCTAGDEGEISISYFRTMEGKINYYVNDSGELGRIFADVEQAVGYYLRISTVGELS